jgi:hypothetical protein
MTQEKPTGTIKWFNPEQGYAFINPMMEAWTSSFSTRA